MADVKNISFGSVIPDKRMTVCNNELIEIKRSYKILNGQAVIIWDIKEEEGKPVFILEYLLHPESTATYLTVNIPAIESTEHTGFIDWGDDTKTTYSSILSYSHTYYNLTAGDTIQVKINCAIEQTKDTSSRLFNGWITSVVFPESMSRVGMRAFEQQSLLSNTDFGNVSRVGAYAFRKTNIQKLYGKNINYIDSEAFAECLTLETIDLPNCEYLGGKAFYYCKLLKSVNLPKIKVIGVDCFQSCTSLEKVEIPNTIEELGNELYGSYTVFSGCTNLKQIIIDKPQDSIKGAPWGAVNAEIIWTG